MYRVTKAGASALPYVEPHAQQEQDSILAVGDISKEHSDLVVNKAINKNITHIAMLDIANKNVVGEFLPADVNIFSLTILGFPMTF